MRWQLTYKNTFTPDDDLGRHNIYCPGLYAKAGYGDVKAGNYVFGFVYSDGQATDYTFSAPFFKAAW